MENWFAWHMDGEYFYFEVVRGHAMQRFAMARMNEMAFDAVMLSLLTHGFDERPMQYTT